MKNIFNTITIEHQKISITRPETRRHPLYIKLLLLIFYIPLLILWIDDYCVHNVFFVICMNVY